MSLLSAPGNGSYQNNAYEVTIRGVVVRPDRVLVKTSTDNSRWQMERCSDDRSSWSLYTSKVVRASVVQIHSVMTR